MLALGNATAAAAHAFVLFVKAVQHRIGNLTEVVPTKVDLTCPLADKGARTEPVVRNQTEATDIQLLLWGCYASEHQGCCSS